MSAATAGSIQTAFNLSNALALLIAAWLADHYGARRVYLVCTWSGAAALACFACFAHSPQTALVGIVLVGLTQGGAYAPALMLAADLSAPQARGRAMGVMLAAGSFGYLLSVFFALWAARSLGPTAGFAVCAAGVLAGAAVGHVSLRGVARAPARAGSTPAALATGTAKSALGPAALCLLVGYVAHCWELLGHYAWTPSLLVAALASSNLGITTTALLVGVAIHVSGMLSTIAFGALSDRGSRSTVLIVVAGAGAMCSLLLGCSMQWHPAWTVSIAAVASFFILGDSGVLSAAISDTVPADKLGRVMGIRSVLGFGAGAVAPITFGTVFDTSHDWQAAYATLAAGGGIAFLAAACLAHFARRSRRRV